MLNSFFRLGLVLLSAASAPLAWGAESNSVSSSSSESATPSNASSAVGATDPSYRLSPGDTIAVSIQGEPDMNTTQTISRGGDVRLVYLTNDVSITGKTVRDAERYLEDLYRKKNVLKKPVVSLTITGYSPREVSVLGEVRSPGNISFPRDLTSMDLVDVITRAGGFTPGAKQYAVVVTHRGADGKDEPPQTVDLEGVISSKRRQNRDRSDILIYPGDRVFVPVRVF